jgi:hypothetical protein
MKHILNNLSEEEKNSIRAKHTGSLEVNTSKFSKLVESTLGDSKPFKKEVIKEGLGTTITLDGIKNDMMSSKVNKQTIFFHNGKIYFKNDPTAPGGNPIEIVIQ